MHNLFDDEPPAPETAPEVKGPAVVEGEAITASSELDVPEITNEARPDPLMSTPSEAAAEQPITVANPTPMADPAPVSLPPAKHVMSSSFESHKFGTVVERHPIPKVKFAEDRREFIMMFVDDIMITRIHFFEDIGYVYSNSTAVRVDGTASVRYVVPIIKLNTIQGEDGQIRVRTPMSGDVKVLALGEDSYGSLVEKHTDHGGLLGRVLKVRCTDSTYQKVEFDVISEDVRAKCPELMQASLRFYEQNKGTIEGSLGKKMSDAELAEALNLPQEGSGELGAADFFTG